MLIYFQFRNYDTFPSGSQGKGEIRLRVSGFKGLIDHYVYFTVLAQQTGCPTVVITLSLVNLLPC